jgi:thioredoxin-like negative regulator of GroEL
LRALPCPGADPAASGDTVAAQETLFRVNIAVEEDLAGSYRINGTPTLIMFLNGKEVGRVDGPNPTVKSVLAAVTEPFQA